MERLIPLQNKTFYDVELAGMNVFELLDKAQRNQINVKFQGPTGAGKTTYFEAFCRKTQQPHFVANMKGSTTSEELIGAFVPNESGEGGPYVWKDGIITRAVKFSNNATIVGVDKETNEVLDFLPGYYAVDKENIVDEDEEKNFCMAWPRCMLTIEEINFSPEELMSVWFSLLDNRRNIILNEKDGEVIEAGRYLSINATMNPDYRGTNELNQALVDRFTIKLDVNYDYKVENKIINELCNKYNLDITFVKKLKSFISHIRKGSKNSNAFRGNISTRMIESYINIYGMFSEEVAETSLVNAFDDEDRGYVKEILKMVKAETAKFTIDTDELEGLELENFKGYNPDMMTQQKITNKKKKKKAPF